MRVLVVEDELNLAESVRRGLTADGFTVEVEANGEDGAPTTTSPNPSPLSSSLPDSGHSSAAVHPSAP